MGSYIKLLALLEHRPGTGIPKEMMPSRHTQAKNRFPEVWAGERAQRVRHPLCKHEDPSWESQHPDKSICIPSARVEVEMGRPLELIGQPL